MRVGLDEQLFGSSRLDILASYFNDKKIAVGVLALLWHDSQNEEVEIATEDQIIDWTRCRNEPVPIVDYLVATKFIEPTGDGKYLIKGNAKHIEKLRSLREKASRGGKATRSKSEQDKPAKSKETRSKRLSKTEANASPNGAPYTILHYSILTPLTGGIGKDVAENLIRAYEARWQSIFERPPTMTNQKVDYLIQILNATGGDLARAEGVLRRYLGNQDVPLYQKSGWDLKFCLDDFDRLDMEADSGFNLKKGRPL
jgi:hypothetical protein